MRRRRKRICLFLLLVLGIGYLIYSFKKEAKSLYEALVCDEKRGRELLQTMCMFYKNGRTAGNLCEDYCNTGLLVIDKCLSHKNDNVIFSATWKNKNIILKAKKRSSYNNWEEAFPDSFNQNVTELRQSFISRMYEHVTSQLVNFQDKEERHFEKLVSPSQVLSLLYFNASLDNLKRNEMQSLWALLQQDEFYIMQLLQSRRHIPHIYGTCWQFYALEQVKTLDSFSKLPIISSPTPWRTRVKIALDLMRLIQELRTETLYGPWQLCDVQPSNFGVSKSGIVKPVDVDLMLTNDKVAEVLEQDSAKCTKNEDCDFFDCVSRCNIETNRCSSNRISNNLQVVCRDLLASSWVETGLLANVPERSKTNFDAILNECSEKLTQPWTKRKYNRIFKTLTDYLTDELKITNLHVENVES